MDNSFWSLGRSITALVIVGILSLATLFSRRALRRRASRPPPGLEKVIPTDGNLLEENLDIEYGGLSLVLQALEAKC
jgi:hypothetical protein